MTRFEICCAAAIAAGIAFLLFVTIGYAAECAGSAREVHKDHPTAWATWYRHDGKRCWFAGKPRRRTSLATGGNASHKAPEHIERRETPSPSPPIAPVIRRASAEPWVMESRWSGVSDTPAAAMERQTGVYVPEWYYTARGRLW